MNFKLYIEVYQFAVLQKKSGHNSITVAKTFTLALPTQHWLDEMSLICLKKIPFWTNFTPSNEKRRDKVVGINKA